MAEVMAVSSNGKCCSVCNVFKPSTEFNNEKCSKDGYHSQCKECRRFRELMSISREESRPPMIVVDGEPTMCEELSLPELKALQKQHSIILNGHYNKKELVEVLKQRGVLSASYTVGRRRVKTHKPQDTPREICEEPTKAKHTPKVNIRGRARRVELTLLDESFQPTESQVFPSLYKAAKFLGTLGCVMTHLSGWYYKSKINYKVYRVIILDPVLA
jgi:hypothetical protein